MQKIIRFHKRKILMVNLIKKSQLNNDLYHQKKLFQKSLFTFIDYPDEATKNEPQLVPIFRDKHIGNIGFT